jgi:hypothetical protein
VRSRRQMGQVWLAAIHASMHGRWKECRHGSRRSSSPPSYSPRQMVQVCLDTAHRLHAGQRGASVGPQRGVHACLAAPPWSSQGAPGGACSKCQYRKNTNSQANYSVECIGAELLMWYFMPEHWGWRIRLWISVTTVACASTLLVLPAP